MKKSALFLLLFVALTIAPLFGAGLDPATMMPDEWTEFRYERLAFIRANPAYAAENKRLESAMAAHAEKVAASMEKADPAAAPVLAKVKKLIAGNWYAPKLGSVTRAEWKLLRRTRAAALAANPALGTSGKDLLKRKNAFDAKVNAALAKEDPGLAPLVKKFGTRATAAF